MGLLNIIRRMKLREKQSIRGISRHTGLSRNTIAKYLNAGTIEPTFTVEPETPFFQSLKGLKSFDDGHDRCGQRDSQELLAGHHHPNDARAPGLSD